MKPGHLLIRFLTGALLLVVALPSAGSAQSRTPPSSPSENPLLPSTLGRANGSGSIEVSLRGENEAPISGTPQITLTAEQNDTVIPQFPRLFGNEWVFTGLPTGIGYELDVRVDGYQPARESVELPDSAGNEAASAHVLVTLKPINEQLTFHPPGGQFVLAPRAQKEVQQGLGDLRSNKIPSAQKHFQKAILLAHGNPYVNYVMGMSYLLAKQPSSAQPYLEESVSLDPNQPASLLALGMLRFNQANYPGAIELLSKAAKLDPSSWKSEWILASAYLNQRDYAQARDHAEKALAVGKQQADPVKLILVEAAAGMGDRAGALATLNNFLAAHPNDPGALRLRVWLANLSVAASPGDKPEVKPSGTPAAAVSQPQPVAAIPPTADLPPKPDWSPPDIDTTRPYVVSGASCSLPRVLKAAGKNATQLVTDLERFSATEEYETVEIKRTQSLEKPVSRTFSYLVFIEHPSDQIIQVSEFRDQGVANTDMPGELVDIGAPGLVLAFHPLLQGDFKWSCEGLGEWKDKPAWVVHFEQRPDRPDRLLSYQSPSGTEPLPLKGRAWVSEDGGQVMHMETDLAQPIPAIKLQREHFVIDYTTVTFAKHKVTLWLPENVDVYFQYRGHYLHHYHHFSDFKLFWTGSTQKIGQPKEAPKDKNN